MLLLSAVKSVSSLLGVQVKINITVAGQYGITLNTNGILENTSYIDDDILDLLCMEIAELKSCPADA